MSSRLELANTLYPDYDECICGHRLLAHQSDSTKCEVPECNCVEFQSAYGGPMPTIPDPVAVSGQNYDLIAHLRSQREWSIKTFGPHDRRRGVIDHLKKELIEIEAMPDDLEEWIDVAMLALDGAWQSGHTPEQVAAAFKAKLIKNQNRQWPDWRAASGDKAIEHVREEPQQ
jgi:hypothetical protein